SRYSRKLWSNSSFRPTLRMTPSRPSLKPRGLGILETAACSSCRSSKVTTSEPVNATCSSPACNRVEGVNFEIGRILHLKSEIVDWTFARQTVQFAISDFGFEMQDSSNFKISSSLFRCQRLDQIQL